MKFSWKFVIALLVVALTAGSVFAQNYPMPGSASAAPVLCTNCEGNNASGEANNGKPTYPYRLPIVKHVGRYVDSSTTIEMQNVGYRTARAGRVRFAPGTRGSAPGRAYLAIGEGVGAYTLSNFFTTTLPSALESVQAIGTRTGATVGGNGRSPLEKIQMFEQFIYPECLASGWQYQLFDAQKVLGDYDFDDRGLVYAAYPPFGWGIVRDTGGSTLELMPKVSQIPFNADIPNPKFIIALHVGSKYYTLVSDEGGTRQMRWDVTDATNPTSPAIRLGAGFKAWSKYETSQRIALLMTDGKIHIYNYADLVTSGPEVASFSPSSGKDFIDLAFDENGTLWAVEGDGRTTNNVIVKMTPAGSTYTRQTFDVYGRKFNPKYMAVGGGYLAVSGSTTIFNGNTGFDVALFKLQGGVPTLVDTDGFFTKFYHTAPSGYAQPPANGGYTNFLNGITLYKNDGKVYLFYSAFGLGDVFELEGSDSVSIQMKTASFGTVNPNSKATQAGPYVGDIVTFQGKSSNVSQTYQINWDFGNPQSDSLNYKVSNTGVDVTHQYTGYTTANQVTATKTVAIENVADTQINATLPVVLKVPTVRVGFPIGGNQYSAVTAATAGLKVVAGQNFTDASDGSVESHFATWTIDGSDTKKKPDATIGVGGIGTHTVKLSTNYGRYDAGTFAIGDSYAAATPSISYTVVPFMAKMNTPVKSGSNIVFTGVGSYTTDTATLSATEWTVTWTLNGTGTSALATQSSTAPIGTIPSFSVPAPISPNSTITLDVSVDSSKLSTPAQGFASAQDSQLLSTPDPKITVTGCEHANETCTLTGGSLSNASTADWTFNWTVKQSGVTLFTSTANPFTPTFTEQGNYTIQLKATKTVFEANATDKALSVAAALCGPLGTEEQINVSSTCQTGCDINELVTFNVSPFGYTLQDCDTITWNFGDGGTATGKRVTHAFTTKKTYNVKMTIKNPTNTTGLTITTPVTVGGSVIEPPPPTCSFPLNIGMTWSGSQGCAPGVACKTGEQVSFSGRRGSGSLEGCDEVAWDFGDGNTSTSRSVSRNTYNTPGTYEITLVVSNTNGSSTPVKQNITIVQAPTNGSCSNTPTEASIYVKYEGATSGCRDTNSVVCKKGEVINFRTGTFGYDIQTCDSFAWTFGDGSTSNARDPQHTYTATGGSFNVSLKVSNSNGNATVTDTIPFENTTNTQPSPVLSYQNFPTTGTKGKSVTFTVNSNVSATNWTWNFGDNTGDDTSQSSATASSRTITHTFTKTGTFTVKVLARNAAGAATDLPGQVLNSITIADAPAEPEYRYLLPVVTHAPGSNSSVWRTDVQIYSQDPTVSPSHPLTMSGVLRDMTRTLEIPSSTYIYEDFMRVFTTGNDSGPVVITAKGQYAPQIWTRTYNQTEQGTFGQFIPAVRIDDSGSGSAFGEGKYYLAGLRHDARYRTNLGLVNPNSSTINVKVTVYNDQGLQLGTFTRTLTSFQLDQFAITAPLPNLPQDRPFSVEIEAPTGQWVIAYASFIDSGSNDPVFMQAVRESELSSTDYRTVAVPGVGHTGAWRSDVTIFNPNGRTINVDLAYHDGDGTKKGEALAVPIRAGEFLQYDDLIKQGVFGSLPDSVGLLRITVPDNVTADRFPMAFARTYNDQGTGKTFGQGIGGFAVPRANVKPNKPALIPAVRDNTKFYSNIGLTNTTGNTVTATVTLLDPSTGGVVRQQQFTLNAYQSVVGRFALDGRDNASLKIEATGNIWAFASIVDKTTLDPEYVAATPLQ